MNVAKNININIIENYDTLITINLYDISEKQVKKICRIIYENSA